MQYVVKCLGLGYLRLYIEKFWAYLPTKMAIKMTQGPISELDCIDKNMKLVHVSLVFGVDHCPDWKKKMLDRQNILLWTLWHLLSNKANIGTISQKQICPKHKAVNCYRKVLVYHIINLEAKPFKPQPLEHVFQGPVRFSNLLRSSETVPNVGSAVLRCGTFLDWGYATGNAACTRRLCRLKRFSDNFRAVNKRLGGVKENLLRPVRNSLIENHIKDHTTVDVGPCTWSSLFNSGLHQQSSAAM